MQKFVAGLVAMVLVGCHSDEREIRGHAEWLCRWSQLPVPGPPQFLPAEAKAELHIRAADLDHVREVVAGKVEDAGLFGGIAAMMLDKLAPATRATMEARAGLVRCEVLGVEVNGEGASATVRVTAPAAAAERGFERLGELASLESHEARVAKAREWLEAGAAGEPEEHTVRFEKTAAGWRARFDLPEMAEDEARRKEAFTCMNTSSAEAGEHVNKGRFAEAQGTLARLDECRATYLAAEGSLALVDSIEAAARPIRDHVAHRTVPVKWVFDKSQNPLDDETTTTLALDAEEEVQARFGGHRPRLFLRCQGGEAEVFFTTGGSVQNLRGDWNAARVRMRLDDGQVAALRASEATSGDALFLPEARALIDQLAGAKRLVLGWEPYGRTEVTAEFDVHGLDGEVQRLWGDCQ